jgi:hypothetical protein
MRHHAPLPPPPALDTFETQRFPQKRQKSSAKAIQSHRVKAPNIRLHLAARIDLWHTEVRFRKKFAQKKRLDFYIGSKWQVFDQLLYIYIITKNAGQVFPTKGLKRDN